MVVHVKEMSRKCTKICVYRCKVVALVSKSTAFLTFSLHLKFPNRPGFGVMEEGGSFI